MNSRHHTVIAITIRSHAGCRGAAAVRHNTGNESLPSRRAERGTTLRVADTTMFANAVATALTPIGGPCCLMGHITACHHCHHWPYAIGDCRQWVACSMPLPVTSLLAYHYNGNADHGLKSTAATVRRHHTAAFCHQYFTAGIAAPRHRVITRHGLLMVTQWKGHMSHATLLLLFGYMAFGVVTLNCVIAIVAGTSRRRQHYAITNARAMMNGR